MNTIAEIRKYQVVRKDWKNIDLIEMKMKAQTVSCLFHSLINTLDAHVSPDEIKLLHNTRKQILTYLDKAHINPLKRKLNKTKSR